MKSLYFAFFVANKTSLDHFKTTFITFTFLAPQELDQEYILRKQPAAQVLMKPSQLLTGHISPTFFVMSVSRNLCPELPLLLYVPFPESWRNIKAFASEDFSRHLVPGLALFHLALLYFVCLQLF